MPRSQGFCPPPRPTPKVKTHYQLPKLINVSVPDETSRLLMRRKRVLLRVCVLVKLCQNSPKCLRVSEGSLVSITGDHLPYPSSPFSHPSFSGPRRYDSLPPRRFRDSHYLFRPSRAAGSLFSFPLEFRHKSPRFTMDPTPSVPRNPRSPLTFPITTPTLLRTHPLGPRP